MKAVALVSFILLLTLGFSSLSTVVQAFPYIKANSTVNAGEILEHIKNGDDINLTNCHIVGELNVNKIKLKTAHNQHLQNLLDEGYDNEWIISNGHYNKLRIIVSNIKIKDSFFEKDFDFSNTQFNGSADFSGTKFNGSANLCRTIFSGSANFSETDFKEYADFSETEFKKYADFSKMIFNSFAFFYGTTFCDSTNFSDMKFEGPATFSRTEFNGPVIFSETYFNSTADFNDVNFYNSTYFSFDTFYFKANFSETNFYNTVNFSKTYFCDYVNFYQSTFKDTVNFFETNFDYNVNFCQSTFKGTANFSETLFYGSANFWQSNFNDSSTFIGPKTAKGIISDEASSQIFIKYYQTLKQFKDVDTIYYNYRQYSMENKRITSVSKWKDILSWIFYGYGVKPDSPFYFSLIVVLLFSIIYYNATICLRKINNKTKFCIYYNEPLIYKTTKSYHNRRAKSTNIRRLKEYKRNNNKKIYFKDAFYFSLATFASINLGEWYCKDSCRKWIILEGLCGWYTLGMLFILLTR